jgi:hypothetical protein
MGLAVRGAVELGYVPRLLGQHLVLLAEAGLANPSAAGYLPSYQVAPGADPLFRVTQFELSLVGTLLVRLFPPSAFLVPYVGGGGGGALFHSRVQSLGSTRGELSPALTYHVVAGAEVPMGRTRLVLEGRYHSSRARLESTGSFDYGGLSATLGLRIRL